MIRTSTQLKAKIQNVSGGDSTKAQSLIRIYVMERFLERVSLSKYKDNFILKGGLLVASLIGSNLRATMDIDTTLKALPINEEETRKIIDEICNVEIDDGMTFSIKSVRQIMEEFDYPGIRIMLEARLDRMRQPIKIDISTDDEITPREIEYGYKLMFEDRILSISSYNIETLLAEKMQTIVVRGIANTRMRDFYDVYEITTRRHQDIDINVLKEAFAATCRKRRTNWEMQEIEEVLHTIEADQGLAELWTMFVDRNFYIEEEDWNAVISYDIGYIRNILMH